MEFSLPVSLGGFLALVLVGVGGLVAGGMMATETVLMMVLPSMLVFGGIAFALGVKHGEYRKTGR